MTIDDTIAAISSATGPAGRMIVRVSGASAHSFASIICPGCSIHASGAAKVSASLNGLDFPIWLYVFTAPGSYTGDDLVEFHIPGNPILARMLLNRLSELGARSAEPGEFTARAYFNGKLDLAQAEGIAATISAQSQRQLAAARQLMAGELSRRLRPAMDLVAQTLALIEVEIDFSEEDVQFLSAGQVRSRLAAVNQILDQLVNDSERFERLAHEPTIVLVGRPNAGKSTLLNALAGVQRAVVSSLAGTTRDSLWAQATLHRGIVRIIDVAGLDDISVPDVSVQTAQADIARQMHRRALESVAASDFVLLVRDSTDSRPAIALDRQADFNVLTKIDLLPESPAISPGQVPVSAATGTNLDLLRQRLNELAFGGGEAESSLALNARHLRAIGDARGALSRASTNVETGAAELIAIELRDALDSLGEVLGAVSPDDILGRIFSTFCIGK